MMDREGRMACHISPPGPMTKPSSNRAENMYPKPSSYVPEGADRAENPEGDSSGE